MSPCEYAWTSFDRNCLIFEHTAIRDETSLKNHPTEKPIQLYKWLLSNFAKAGDKILDTHVGSASSLIACREMGFSYVGYEIDEDYYKAACGRLQGFTDQMNIFDFKEGE